MRRFNELPIKRKLMVIIMIPASISVLVIAMAVLITEAIQQRSFLYDKRQEQLSALLSIIGSRSTAALIYNDPQTADENLRALQNLRDKNNILFAAIHDQQGEMFVEYRHQGGALSLEEHSLSSICAEEWTLQLESILAICVPIVLDGERIGDTRIFFDMRSDLRLLQTRMQRFLMLALFVVLLTSALAFLLSSYLQKYISGPVLRLSKAMEEVSEKKDYSVRVVETSRDELGTLSAGFNDMLSQIMERDSALAKHSAMLEEEVLARTRALEMANKRRVSWLENIARVLRHELKNNIVGVKSSLDLIDRRLCSEGELVQPYIMRARTSMSNMGKLLDSVSNASTLEAAVYKEPKSLLVLSQLITGTVQEYVEVHPFEHIEADCDQGLHVIGSELLIKQMLTNLVSNAVEHRRAGTSIVVSLQEESGEALLSVTDEGDPLPENIERIFDLFVSIRPPERKNDGNIGLGLNLVKLIAEFHGGSVSAENFPDASGAVFKVRIPLAS